MPRSATIIAEAPLFKPGALPAVIVPSLRKAGRSLARLSIVVSGLLLSSLSKTFTPLWPRTSTGVISSLNLPAACAAAKRCCDRNAQRSCSSRVIWRDLAKIFGVPAGMFAGKRVVEAVAQHAVVELRVAHAVAPSPVGDEVGRHVHVLHAAGDRAVEHAEHDLLRGGGDALRAGAADAVDRHGGNIDRYAAVDGGLPRRVHLVAGLDDIAHHHRADFRRVKFRTRQHGFDGDRRPSPGPIQS